MGPLRGLSSAEAAESRAVHGENSFEAKKRKGFVKKFFESFGDPIIRILLIALFINIVFLFRDSNWFESLGIGLAILLATIVQTVSEYGSETAFERLQEEAAQTASRVRRDGELQNLPVASIVVGDIVLLSQGDRVPADGVLLEGRLDVDQSSINGESLEAVKLPGKSGEASLLFGGTVVCGGTGHMRVTNVGASTVLGKIGREIQIEKREGPLNLRLRGLAGKVGKLGYIAALITAAAYFFNVLLVDNNFDRTLFLSTLTDPRTMFSHFLRALTLAVTVVVMAVPEGLPMMITVVLSSNMRRMFKDNVLVRKLVGIETAGSLNILFTDKTGTLTGGRLEVTAFLRGDGTLRTGASPLDEALCDAIRHNSAAEIVKGSAIGGNATDRAALESAEKLDHEKRPKSTKNTLRKLEVIPFSSQSKFMATNVTDGTTTKAHIKGAPEKILPRCNRYYSDSGEVRTITGAETRKVNAALEKLASQAMRVIAVAVSETPVKDEDFQDLVLIGFLGIRDEIRKEAAEGVSRVRTAGIQIVMITGDQKSTAVAIAKETGILREDEDGLCLTSDELSKYSDKELAELLPRLRVVARALPGDKSRLVRIAQDRELVTGMTGDGVNDAPALKLADIGFAMGSGTEVAKEAGDIVILDDNILSIAKAVSYGRTIFKSIRKFIVYQLSICMCAVGVTIVGPLIGVDMPITVIQMLWINMVMDTLAGIAFSGETSRQKYMKEPPKPRTEAIINKYMFSQIATISVYTTALCLFFIKSPFIQGIFTTDTHRMTAFFALFMFCAIFTSFCARTHTLDLTDYLAANKPFLWIMGIVTAVQIIIIYFGGPIFRTAGIEARHLLLCVAMAATIVPVDLARKFVLRRVQGEGAYTGT